MDEQNIQQNSSREDQSFLEGCVNACNMDREQGADGFYRDTVCISENGSTAARWAVLLSKHPELISKCEINKLNGFSRCYLLSNQPQLVSLFSMEELADANHPMWSGSEEDFKFGWKMLVGARPQFGQYQKEVMRSGVLIMDATLYSINRSETGARRRSEQYFADASFTWLDIEDASLSEESNLRYGQIVNAGDPDGSFSESDSDCEGESSLCWDPASHRHAATPRYLKGKDVATLSGMGQSAPCRYSVQLHSGVPKYICELFVRGGFDSDKFEVVEGKMYLPDLDWCDENGCVDVITEVRYDGKRIDFWCADIVESDNGWDVCDEWHYVVEKNKSVRVGLDDKGNPKWPE